MDNQKKKCSLKKHSEIDAILFCHECKKFFCNKCQNYHSEIFDDHKTIKLNNLDEIFIDTCKENNHTKLEFYCKEHNTLCCGSCITKIKEEGYGQHSDCNVCHINYIKDEKKNKLKENIKHLEELYNQIEKSINEIKIIYEEINKNKECLQQEVLKLFTKIRCLINERKDKIMLEIETQYNKLYFKEELIKKSEKLPKKINLSLEKGKSINDEWNNDNKLSYIIYNCINIENNIKEMNEINDCIKKYNETNFTIKFVPEEEELDLNIIDSFGKIKIIDELDKKQDNNIINLSEVKTEINESLEENKIINEERQDFNTLAYFKGMNLINNQSFDEQNNSYMVQNDLVQSVNLGHYQLNDEEKNIDYNKKKKNKQKLHEDDITKFVRIIKDQLEEYKSKNIQTKLIYDAQKDGGNDKVCHLKCNNIPNTFSIVTTNKKHKFGFFKSIPINGDGPWREDDKAFFFSYDKNKIYKIKKRTYSVGFDNNSFIQTKAFSLMGNILEDKYSCHKQNEMNYFFNGFTEDYELNCGEKYFYVENFKVYQLEY